MKESLYRDALQSHITLNDIISHFFTKKFKMCYFFPVPCTGTSTNSSGLCMLIDALNESEQEEDVWQMIRPGRPLQTSTGTRFNLPTTICSSSLHYPHASIKKGLSLVVEEQPVHG